MLRQLGYTSLLLQIGRGQYEPEARELSDQSPAVQFYRFKDSIADDIAAADLVICHAGKCGLMRSEFKSLTLWSRFGAVPNPVHYIIYGLTCTLRLLIVLYL